MNTKTLNGYIVTDDGRVFTRAGHELPQRSNRKGYRLISWHPNGQNKSVGVFVHRIVALAFVANPMPLFYTQVNHIDGNPANNNADNLEWCDLAYNMRDRAERRKRLGLPWCTIKATPTGEAKPVEYVGVTYPSLKAMARHFGVCPQSILEGIKHGKWRKNPIKRMDSGSSEAPSPDPHAHGARSLRQIYSH